MGPRWEDANRLRLLVRRYNVEVQTWAEGQQNVESRTGGYDVRPNGPGSQVNCATGTRNRRSGIAALRR